MKHIILALVASVFAISLTACGEDTAKKQEEDRAKAAMEQKENQDNQNTMDIKVKPVDNQKNDTSTNQMDDQTENQ